MEVFCHIVYLIIKNITLMALNYFAADRTARPPNEPSWVPWSGTDGPPHQGGAK